MDSDWNLFTAATNGSLGVAKYAIRQGAEVNEIRVDGSTALQIAAKKGHLRVTKYLISQGADVNQSRTDGATALHWSAQEGHLDVTEYLISQGAEVNKRQNEGWTALHLAAEEDHLDVTEYLIRQGAEVNLGRDNGWTALHSAAKSGHLNVTKCLISQGADVNQSKLDGGTALHWSAQQGHLNVTKYLISQGAEVNKGNNDGRTALHIASRNGHLDIIKYLISQEADLNKGDNTGWTALDMSSEEDHLDVTEYLISQGADVNQSRTDGGTALHCSSQQGHLNVTEYLICQGAEVNRGMDDGLTALHNAARNGHLDVTKYLISQGADVNQSRTDGGTALHWSAQEGHLNVTKYLISQGAEVNKGDNEGWNALHFAAEENHLDVIEYLYSQGADLNRGKNDGWTALHSAAQKGHVHVIKYLTSQGAEVNRGKDNGWTALHSAATNGHLAVAKYLIRHGADVNQNRTDGRAALYWSAQKGHLGVTKYLIRKGADVNKGDNNGWTALHIAATSGKLVVTKYLISKGASVNQSRTDGGTALHCSSQQGHLNATEYLISQGAEVNKGDNKGRTALHLAASNDCLDLTEYLISQGADENKGDNNGWTALHNAAKKGYLDVTTYLISQGADLNRSGADGRTSLHLSVQEGHLDVSKYLISQGAEVNKKDIEGWTALHLAALNGCLDHTEYLISQGAEVKRGMNEGWTALHSAAQQGHFDVTRYLISQGAEVNGGNNDGRTALHIAAKNGHLDVIRCVISQGADVNKGDNDGLTALHHAVRKGYLEVVKVLLEEGARLDVRDNRGQTPLQLCLILGYQSIADLFIDRLNDKLDKTDFPYIFHATHHGHTSTIEKLVLKAADLNVQSTDGQTCLHEAIKLCNESRKNVQETNTLKKISDKYYNGELSPGKSLVIYLLENGAKLDVKDERGNLPIHYAKDEEIKQMIFARIQSFEEIQSYRDEPSAPAIASGQVEGNASQEIKLEDLDVSLFIPPNAVHQNDSCKITITLLRDLPSVYIQNDELMACFGIRCEAPTMIFHQPVKIRIPHSSLVVNPDLVKPDIVSRAWDSVKDLPIISRKTSSNSPDEPPYCKVHRRHLELHIGHCAEWWVLIPLEQGVIRHQLMCTTYIPGTIERRQVFEIHLQMNADLPGMEKNVEEEKKQQLYRKNHRSVPFSVESKSGDVTVTCHREGDQVESTVVSLKDVYGKMSHNVVLSVTPSEDDVEFQEFTITITQAGRPDVSRSIVFIIRYTDGQGDQGDRFPSEPPSFLRAVEEVLESDLPDTDVLAIAQTMTVNQFYDLGVALGFTIRQLDVIEHRRFHDREQAIYDLLIIWRKNQPFGLAAKDTFLSLMESLKSPAEEIAISDPPIPDRTLPGLGRHIAPKKYYEIGVKLGFNESELEHIEHRTSYKRKEANIQMLSSWKASQTSGPKAKQTLELIWKSLHDASKTDYIKDEEEEEASQELEVNSTSPPKEGTEQSEFEEPEYIEIISHSDSVIDGDETSEDIDLCGGSPSTREQCSIARPVNCLSLAWDLGKALRLDDAEIVGYVTPSDHAVMNRLAWQLLNKWCKRVGSQEKTEVMTKLLQVYNIQDCNAGRDAISRRICTTKHLLDFSKRLDLVTSDIIQVISTSVSFLPTSIRHIVLQMLQEWVRLGGTRQRLLEIAQTFHFNDAADKIATEMERHPGFLDPFSHGIIGHDGGELKLGELDIGVSIPAGALPKGMISVVTLSVPNRCPSKIPLKDGEVLITPVIECSLTQELLKPATVALEHYTNPEQYQDGLCVKLYTKFEPGTFRHGKFLPIASRGFPTKEDVVVFPTRHLELWALASSNFRGVQFTCEVFQRLFMDPSQTCTLRICIAHPCNRYPAEMRRRQESLSEQFYQPATVIKFSLESKEDDLKLWCLSDSEKVQETVPVRGLLKGECNTVDFELMSSPDEGGVKSICLRIEQGTSTIAEQQIPTTMEVEPDYGASQTFGQVQFASDTMLNVLAGVVCAIKDARDLGYQLGFAHSTVEKYLDRADSSVGNASSSGFREMLCDWRRRVRPNEQVTKLRLALEEAGLSYAAEVLLPEI